jgi:aspartyl-tRNA(Asn)/glutamyl-tRNA(Gln) amidotransferase subunit C
VALPPGEIDRLARLARLRLTPEEVERGAEELASILDHLDVLRVVGPAPAGEPDGGPAPLRDDRVGPDPLGEPLSRIAPRWEGGYFEVPRPPAVGPGEEE